MNSDIQHSFKALADPTRRQILMHLSEKDMTIADITGQFDITRAAIKKHLNILENGSFISVKTSGRERINSLETKGIKSITDWLGYFDQFWDKKLDRLQDAIAKNEKNRVKNTNEIL